MIEYVIAHSPDERVLQKAKTFLDNGALIVFPTDTNWQIVCNPYKPKAVELLYRLKGENIHKHFSFLCDTISRASEIAKIDDHAYKIIKKLIPGNYTFIFNAKKQIRKAVSASKTDHEVGIRFSPSLFVQKFINYYDQVLLSTNITSQMLELQNENENESKSENDKNEIYGVLIEESIGHLLKMIIDPGLENDFALSSIISMTNELPQVLRVGAGDVSLFH